MRLIVLGLLLAGTLWLIRQALRDRRRQGGGQGRAGGGAEAHLVPCAVCHTFIPRDGAITLKDGAETRHFCSERCASVFRDEH